MRSHVCSSYRVLGAELSPCRFRWAGAPPLIPYHHCWCDGEAPAGVTWLNCEYGEYESRRQLMNAAVAFQSFVQLFPSTHITLIFPFISSFWLRNYQKNKILRRGMAAVLPPVSFLETYSELLEGWIWFSFTKMTLRKKERKIFLVNISYDAWTHRSVSPIKAQ